MSSRHNQSLIRLNITQAYQRFRGVLVGDLVAHRDRVRETGERRLKLAFDLVKLSTVVQIDALMLIANLQLLRLFPRPYFAATCAVRVLLMLPDAIREAFAPTS